MLCLSRHPSATSSGEQNTMEQTGSSNFVGSVINGRYEVVKEIGSGSFGTVYKVHDRNTGADLALKRLSYSKDDPKIQKDVAIRFKREMEILSALTSDNVVRIIDCGTSLE